MRKSLRQQESSGKRDYSIYYWKQGELFLEVTMGIAVTGLFAWFFYRSIWAIPPMGFIGVYFFRKRVQYKTELCKRELIMEFQECILSVSASLQAGYSIENCFLECFVDMKQLYGENSLICTELEIIKRGMGIHIPLEELLWDLGKRSNASDIIEFAEVLTIAKRSGGSIPEIIRSSAELIKSRTIALQEIQTIISARKLEQKVMNVMPFGILIYIESTNQGYFSPLYHSFYGVIIMSGCLLFYLGAYYLSGRILNQASDIW